MISLTSKYHRHLLLNSILILTCIVLYVYFSANQKPLDLSTEYRRIVSQDRFNLYQDEENGFSFALPPNTHIKEVNSNGVVISRGNVIQPDYLLAVSTDTYDERITPAQYLAAYKERATHHVSPGYTLIFSQSFDHQRVNGVHMVFQRNDPHQDIEEVFILASGGRSVFLSYHYSLNNREVLEPEIFWTISTFEFVDE